jgi:hypothetical protein
MYKIFLSFSLDTTNWCGTNQEIEKRERERERERERRSKRKKRRSPEGRETRETKRRG